MREREEKVEGEEEEISSFVCMRIRRAWTSHYAYRGLADPERSSSSIPAFRLLWHARLRIRRQASTFSTHELLHSKFILLLGATIFLDE